MTTKTDQLIDQQIQCDKLQLMYYQSFPAVFYTAFAAIIFAVIFWPQVNQTHLSIWLAFVFVISVLRIGLFLAYRKIRPREDSLLKWQQPYFLSLIITTSIWGVGTVLLTYDQPLLYQIINYFFLIGLAGAALTFFAAIQYFALTVIAILLLPITVLFLIHGESNTVAMAIACIAFLIASQRSTKIMAATLHRSYMLTHELTMEKEKAELLARKDSLTGINTRRAFSEFSKQQIEFCFRQKNPVSLLVLDVEGFKDINEEYGHTSGDVVLKQLADIIQMITRTSDISGRIGCDEFAILLLDASVEEAKLVANKILIAVAENTIEIDDHSFSFSVSIGIAGNSYDLDNLTESAITSMYKAKEQGANQAVCYDPEPALSKINTLNNKTETTS